ncbi:membrane protein insertase YidC [Rudanella lutea]|uniref:membrane protein insertase YidC n=1 Tax=Rudanella lutea TaxID=451374 RepID=UPI000368B0DF|nr:membrane protein insertase YidC [Rudanella lutea]
MDRNQLIGILLILAMLVGYQFLVPKPEQTEQPAQTTKVTKPSASSATSDRPQTLDSAAARALYGDFAGVSTGQERDIVLENKDVKVTFSTLGGRVKEVLLKNYKTFDGKPLLLIDSRRNQTVLELPTSRGKVDLHKLYYQTGAQSGSVTGGATQVAFRAEVAPGQAVEQVYSLPAEGFTIDYDLRLNGLTNVGNGDVRFFWQDRMEQFENDLKNNRLAATVNYLTAGEEFDHLAETESSDEVTVEEPVKWFSIKHKYFLASFITKNAPLNKANFRTLVDPADSLTVKTAVADVSLPMADLKSGKGQYRFYYGPNDFQVIKEGIAPEFDRNVYLGYSILKPINKYFFVPVFNLLEKFISNYGILIVLLVVFVKLLLTPLTYKSYVSMAKMRVLAPELAEIREKVGDDMAKQQQEQMKLYQQVGVSPLSGCVPVLATMPILLALFQLFPNLIELRGKSFLWAPDLSTYDAFLQFPLAIPFLGNHLSLFTVLMTISSIAYAYYNNQTTPQQPGPVNMKALSYIFPVMFMFVLNSFPAGLTWYYFVSNVVTIAQQQLIRRFVDEDKIRLVLDENKKKFASGEGKKSKFQSYIQKQLAAAEEARKQAEEAQRNLEKRGKKK